MNRILAEISDICALYQFHREKSLVYQFSNFESISMPEEPRLFYFQPQNPKIGFYNKIHIGNYESGSFRFKSEVDNGNSNKYVSGTYYQKSALNTHLNAILIHGWRQDIERIKEIYLKPFVNNGYDSYFITLPYHAERQEKSSLYSGEFMISANIERTLSSIRQAVVDLRALISWLKASRQGKVILIGISLGGLIANLTATVEPNIDGVISVFSPSSLSYAVWNTIPGKYIKKDFEENGYTYDRLRARWAIINADNFNAMISKEKVLIISALYDRYVAIYDADSLWEKWGKPARKLYHCGHTGLGLYKDSIVNDTLAFINRNG